MADGGNTVDKVCLVVSSCLVPVDNGDLIDS